MRRALKWTLIGLGLALAAAILLATWHLRGKLPQRDGEIALSGLTAPVSVRFDERGVPHIRAANEADLYRALGFVHAQDRLFQMELMRRVARGEMAEILGPKLLETDQLFRTLGIRVKADAMAAAMDRSGAPGAAMLAYLEGVNSYQHSRPTPIEFQLMGIPKRAFTPADAYSIAGFLAYTFAAAFRTEPALTYVRDQLGADYLKVFDLDFHPQGVVTANALDWNGLNRLARVSREALEHSGVASFEGSNAWAIAGARTASGKPLLAGDPHIGFAAPAVWYEAHLFAPGFELYGHFMSLFPMALLGHNGRFGWTLTMFQNDDLDLIAEKVNPDKPNQVLHRGQWVDLLSHEEIIKVKGAEPVRLNIRRSPHGPIVSPAFGDKFGAKPGDKAATAPVSMWWAFLETENPVQDAFYELNRADTLAKARSAASRIHAPGLNLVWANAAGDIGWWAAAKLPQRPKGVNPAFILDAGKGEAEKPGFHPFAANPQEENPARGYILSANHQPQGAQSPQGIEVPGYYNQFDRAQRLDDLLRVQGQRWDQRAAQAMQLDVRTGYGPRLLAPLLADLRAAAVPDATQRELVDKLALWDGAYPLDSVAPSVFVQFLYELAQAAMADEMGPAQFANLLSTRALDLALPRLAADPASPWWDKRGTPAIESRASIVKAAWDAAIKHLQATMGQDSTQWTWGKAHTLTHGHAMGQQKPLDLLFNVGPFEVPGGRETPNNMARSIGPLPWKTSFGPSTRRVIDFAKPERTQGGNPVGQSGVLFDQHYADQASAFASGRYMPQHLAEADVAAHTRSTLALVPPR
jgi:penicillin amidase